MAGMRVKLNLGNVEKGTIFAVTPDVLVCGCKRGVTKFLRRAKPPEEYAKFWTKYENH